MGSFVKLPLPKEEKDLTFRIIEEIRRLDYDEAILSEKLSSLLEISQHKSRCLVLNELQEFQTLSNEFESQASVLSSRLQQLYHSSEGLSSSIQLLNSRKQTLNSALDVVGLILKIRLFADSASKNLDEGNYEEVASVLTQSNSVMQELQQSLRLPAALPTSKENTILLSFTPVAAGVAKASEEAANPENDISRGYFSTLQNSTSSSSKKEIGLLDDGKEILSDERVYFNMLVRSEKRLIALVRKEFEKAIAQSDKEGVSRFAKLLLSLGLQGEGIGRYILFVRSMLNDKCASYFRTINESSASKLAGKKREGYHKNRDKGFSISSDGSLKESASSQKNIIPIDFAHVEVLSKVFALIAEIVYENQQNIESEFGYENFIVFMRGIQEEADLQAIRVLNKFVTDRRDFINYEFNSKDEFKSSDEQFSPREIGTVLKEISLLSQHSQKFDRFLRGNAAAVMQKIPKDSELFKATQKLKDYNINDGLLTLSELNTKMQELMGSFVSLTHTYMEISIRKALNETDEINLEDTDQPNSTLVEDVFFIFQGSISDAIQSGDIYAACAVVNHVISLLAVEVKASLEKNLVKSKGIYLDYVSRLATLGDFSLSLMVNEAISNTHTGKSSKPIIVGSEYSFLHSLNNIKSCLDYVGLFRKNCEDEMIAYLRSTSRNTQPFNGSESRDWQEFLEKEAQTKEWNFMKFQQTLLNLDPTIKDLDALHSTGCTFVLSILTTNLSKFFQPLYRVNFEISESEYSDLQVNDPFVKKFIGALRSANRHLQNYYNSQTRDLCLKILSEKVCKRIEEIILEKDFTRFGGSQLGNDVRSLLSFFNSISDDISYRSQFRRLLEISEILSLDSVSSLKNHWSWSGMGNWCLNGAEIRVALTRRVDFDKEDIEKIFIS